MQCDCHGGHDGSWKASAGGVGPSAACGNKNWWRQ